MASFDRQAYENYADGRNPFASASVVLGCVAALTFSSIYPAIFAGSLAIIFGTLSRRGSGKVHPLAKGGMICGSISLILGLILAIMYALSNEGGLL